MKRVIHSGLDVYVFSNIYNGVQIEKNKEVIGVYKGILDIENADGDYLIEMVNAKFLA